MTNEEMARTGMCSNMPMNDIIYVDNDFRLCGWDVGMSEEDRAEYREKYRTCTYKDFVTYWENKD